jgi:hypothetical protein
MINLLKEKKAALANLCREHSIASLEVFGSAADETFDSEQSDVDFLVEFLPGHDLGPWLANYFAFQAALEELLGRKVDLVVRSAMRNPYFIREVNRTRQVLYAA